MVENNRDKALRGEVVKVSDHRLLEMQEQAVFYEGVTSSPIYHWHWVAAVNELVALRTKDSQMMAAAVPRCRGYGPELTENERVIVLQGERIQELESVLSELADLMQGVIDGSYRPDSFTLQPARRILTPASGGAGK